MINADGTVTTGTKLLSRDEFRAAVFARDNGHCIVPGCPAPAIDAHHIVERRLWSDGGYFLENGASLCPCHHLKAERTDISCDDLRRYAGISVRHLPAGFDPNEPIDKWGNIILNEELGIIAPGPLFSDTSVQGLMKLANRKVRMYRKFPRIPHLDGSPGATLDDLHIDYTHYTTSAYCKNVVVTEKADGENCTWYSDYIHARSIYSRPHPSRDWVKNLHASIRYDIPPGFRICGENVFAVHSIKYTNLPSYFLVFAIFDDQNTCLSWADTQEWCELLQLSMVPMIYQGPWNSVIQRQMEHHPSSLGTKKEGFVIRPESAFPGDQYSSHVAKFVRKNHVTTDEHWMNKAIEVNGLQGKGEPPCRG